jgi:ubiquinone/menaquinone biosynthesis C-methylase UbiE
MDPGYLLSIAAVRFPRFTIEQLRMEAHRLKNTIIKEIYRVLRPGGSFISLGDFSSALDCLSYSTLTLWFGLPHRFSGEAIEDDSLLDQLYVFQKNGA